MHLSNSSSLAVPCLTTHPSLPPSSPARLDVLSQPPRESSLKYQTRCVAAFSGAPSFALGSVEGRVAMEVLDPAPAAQDAKYAFKVSYKAG